MFSNFEDFWNTSLVAVQGFGFLPEKVNNELDQQTKVKFLYWNYPMQDVNRKSSANLPADLSSMFVFSSLLKSV